MTHWEFSIAVPDAKERDAFSAIAAADITTHYMFDHLRIDNVGWRVRDDNRASQAIIRRMGYVPYVVWGEGAHRYQLYRINTELWAKRRAKLDRGEEQNPSGLGDAFITLAEPPFDPVEPDFDSSEAAEEGDE
jgi:hypothetical protein